MKGGGGGDVLDIENVMHHVERATFSSLQFFPFWWKWVSRNVVMEKEEEGEM